MATIRDATTSEDLGEVRELFLEYANSLGFSLCFQGFDHELASLPGEYAAEKRGALLVAELPSGEIVGCVALHASFGEAHHSHIAEIKRLYVRPSARGQQLGRKLVEAAMQRARDLGYTHMRLDTVLSKMPEAVELYQHMGFYTIEAYRPNPMADVIYMEAAL
jgi:GNAT superfamily N-acetyltransferase